jgi:CRP/FNR family cyclic AMP-dependent transcriptional regulator
LAVTRVLDEDPELGERLPAGARRHAEDAAIARTESLSEGTWREPDDPASYRDGFGLLVLDGILARRVEVDRFESIEVLGQGDLLRPWSFEAAGAASIPSGVVWNVLEPVRLAALDRSFALATAPWPELSAALMDRIVMRVRWLAFQLAVSHLVRVDVRLLATLWHYADRWGRMTPDGVMLRMPVTHSMLAGIVGSRRPSVTTALGRLERRGLVERRRDGSWLLRGEAPREFGRWNGRGVTARAAETGARSAGDPFASW